MKPFVTQLFFVALLLSPIATETVTACINEVGRSTVGETIYVGESTPEEFMKALNTRQDQKYWKGVLNDLSPTGKLPKLVDERNTVAVAMLHLGRIREAIEILEAIEREKPGLYYSAANLGTAYELNGENAKALKWITEGTRRDPTSHNGSEWLHVKILEAKIALEKDPDWLARNSVTGINGHANEVLLSNPAVLDHLGQTKNVEEIERALVYQLHERLEFIRPPEAVVASLLFDLSRILSIRHTDDHGAAVWVFAKTYGPDLMPWSLDEPALPLLPPSYLDSPFLLPGVTAVCIAVLGGIGLILLRRRT